MSDAVGSFFDNGSAEDAGKMSSSYENAPDVQVSNVRLDTPGKYVMKVQSFAYRNKEKEIVSVPDFYTSDTKGTLMLNISMAVVKPTDNTPVGASIFVNMPIMPKPGSSQKAYDNIASLTKPRLTALFGNTIVKWDHKWMVENMTAEYKEDSEGRFKLVRDHNMKGLVLCEFEEDEYQGRVTLNLKRMERATDLSQSMSDKPAKSTDIDQSKLDDKDIFDSIIDGNMDNTNSDTVDY